MPPRKSKSIYRNTVTARAVTAEQAKPSFEDIVRELKSREEAVTRQAGIEGVARQSAAAAPSAAVSGALLLGPNLYRKLGGDVEHPSLPKEGSAGWTALEAAGLLPFGRPLRGVRAGVKGAKALLTGKAPAAGVAAKVPSPRTAMTRVETRVDLTLSRRAELEEIVDAPVVDYADLFRREMAERALRRGYEYVRVPSAPAAVKGAKGTEDVIAAGKAVTPLGKAAKTQVPRPEGAEKIVEALPGAKRLRRRQEGLYRAERGKRAAKAEQAMEEGGKEGYLAALKELKGELPKLKFGAIEKFDQEATDALFSHVQQHPELRTFEKIRTQSALQKVLEGGAVPTRSDIKLLERVFGPEVAAQIADSVPFWKRAKDLGLSLINVPRALRASYDLSAPFRQGLVLGARHPSMFSREFAPMVKSFGSESYYQELMDDIVARPTYEAMQTAKLQLTDLASGVWQREEQFMSNLAEKIPVIGRGVRASGRAYTGFLNKFRADAFDNYLRMAESQGLDIEDPALLKGIARWLNHATGRGSVKSFEDSMVVLNAVLFSPRLIASRLQLLNPVFYATLDPFARKQAVQGMAQLLGGISLTLWTAKMAGAEVGMDPRSADFGKIKIGDTRVDVAGGFQQYLVAASRLVKGESVSSTTGKVTSLTETGFAKPSRADILANFAENKLAPVPAWGVDFLKGENFAGDKFDPLKEGGRAFLPLGLENAYEGYTVGGPPTGAASLLLGGIGFGTQTYRPDEERGQRRTRGGRRRSKSIYRR